MSTDVGLQTPAPALAQATTAKKKKKTSKPRRPNKHILNDLRALAAVYALGINYERRPTDKKGQQDLIEKRYHGRPIENVASTLDLVLQRSPPFDVLYDTAEHEDGIEYNLRRIVSWGDAEFTWVLDKNFNRKLLTQSAWTNPNSALVPGRTLKRNAENALKNCKKALAIATKLSFMLQLDDSGRIVGYASGCTEQDFIRKIRDGMHYTLKQGDGPEYEQ